jgi:hypothetical protein
MRFGLSAKAVADVNDVKTGLIRTRRIVFTPTVALKEELANTAINITCYDRNGDVVKRVTSDDPGTVEEPEQGDDNGTDNLTPNPSPSGEGNENQNQNTGGGDDTGGDNTGGDNTGSDNPGDNGGFDND